MAVGDDPILDFAVTDTAARLRRVQSDLRAADRALESMGTQVSALSSLVVILEQAAPAASGLQSHLPSVWADDKPNPRLNAVSSSLDRTSSNVQDALDTASAELTRLYNAMSAQGELIAQLGATQQQLSTSLANLRALQASTPAPVGAV